MVMLHQLMIKLLFIVNHVHSTIARNIFNQTSTLANATSVTSDNCYYHRSGIYETLRSNDILQNISIQDYTINIQLDVKINHYCKKLLCNIMYISTDNEIGGISVSTNSMENLFEIRVATDINFTEIHKIPNMDKLLPVDGQYHHLHLIHTFIFPGD
eukprot:153082_1